MTASPARPVVPVDPEPRAVGTIVTDITERNRADEHLRLRDAELETEFVGLHEAVREGPALADFVGESPVLRSVLREIQLVAPTDAAVLITGESGTGKELVARAIRDGSARRERAMVTVNCASVPRDLFESEFFGHLK